MRITRAVPGRTTIAALALVAAAALLALLAGLHVATVTRISIAECAAIALAAGADYLRSVRTWRQASPVMKRHLPAAFAIGVEKTITLAIESSGGQTWRCELHDHSDAALSTEGMPVRTTVEGGKRVELTYRARPASRGEMQLAPADLRVGSRWGFWDLLERIGPVERRRV